MPYPSAPYTGKDEQIIPHLIGTDTQYWPVSLIKALSERLNTTPEQGILLQPGTRERLGLDQLIIRWAEENEDEARDFKIYRSGLTGAFCGH